MFRLTAMQMSAVRNALALALVCASGCNTATSERRSVGSVVGSANNSSAANANNTRFGIAKSARTLEPKLGDAVIGAGNINAGWTLLDGRSARLADHAGDVIVLDFYATWCPPCRDEVPYLVELQRRYGANGLRIIGLNVGGDEDRAAIPDFVARYKISYQLGFPAEALVEPLMRDNDAIPQTFVFDREGRLVRRFVGFDPTVAAEIEQTIQQTLNAPAS